MEHKQNRFVLNQRRSLAVSALVMVAFHATAGDWKITPSISVKETATDNVALANDAQKQSDLVTDLNPGLHIEGKGGRSSLRFDYQLHELIHAQNSARNQTQNQLNALGTLEAIDNWLFIEASGVISQQSISAFGPSSSSSTVNINSNGNTTETSTYRLSPYVRGSLGRIADYQVRYNLTTTSTRSSNIYDSDARELLASLKGATPLSSLGWSLDASRKRIEFGNGRSNEDDRLRGVLTYQISPQLHVLAIAGRESNDYLSLDKQSHNTSGGGIEWAPTERTQISATREKRFFGNSNSFSFSHRTARTAWRYKESKDATVLPSQQASANLGTYYELAQTICLSLLPQGYSAAELSTCTNGLLGGIPPGAQVPGGFLTSGVTLQQRREMSFALQGIRNTVTFSAFRTESENLSQGAGTGLLLGTDFENVNNIRQRGASINWSHKLTGLTSLIGNYSLINSKGSGVSTLETKQKLFTLNLTTKLGPHTTAGIGARRVVSDGTSDYTENALTGILSHQF